MEMGEIVWKRWKDSEKEGLITYRSWWDWRIKMGILRNEHEIYQVVVIGRDAESKDYIAVTDIYKE